MLAGHIVKIISFFSFTSLHYGVCEKGSLEWHFLFTAIVVESHKKLIFEQNKINNWGNKKNSFEFWSIFYSAVQAANKTKHSEFVIRRRYDDGEWARNKTNDSQEAFYHFTVIIFNFFFLSLFPVAFSWLLAATAAAELKLNERTKQLLNYSKSSLLGCCVASKSPFNALFLFLLLWHFCQQKYVSIWGRGEERKSYESLPPSPDRLPLMWQFSRALKILCLILKTQKWTRILFSFQLIFCRCESDLIWGPKGSIRPSTGEKRTESVGR